MDSKLPVPFKNRKNEAIASLYWTALHLRKVSQKFLSPFLSSDAQFNILILLRENLNGITQKDLSKKLVVDKSNITGLIDRMENLNLLKRVSNKEDSRSYIIQLTAKGKKLAEKMETLYLQKVDLVLSQFSEEDIQIYIQLNQKIREGLLFL